MSHTPGPWTIQRYTNYYGFSIYAESRGCIAERWYSKEQVRPYRDEMEANARLIAAAPALLQSLKSLLGFLDPDSVNDRRTDVRLQMEYEAEIERAKQVVEGAQS